MLGLTICLAAVGYVAGPVAAMVVRLRGRHHIPELNARLWPPIRRRLAKMVWTGLGLLLSVVAFIMLLVLFSINQAGAWPSGAGGLARGAGAGGADAHPGGHRGGRCGVGPARGHAAEPLAARGDRGRAGRHRPAARRGGLLRTVLVPLVGARIGADYVSPAAGRDPT
ncbi:hypothetical protein ACFSTC_16935 [Nonomuraea ferruginea]